MNYVNMSLTLAIDLNAISLCVNKKGKMRVKVHFQV